MLVMRASVDCQGRHYTLVNEPSKTSSMAKELIRKPFILRSACVVSNSLDVIFPVSDTAGWIRFTESSNTASPRLPKAGISAATTASGDEARMKPEAFL